MAATAEDVPRDFAGAVQALKDEMARYDSGMEVVAKAKLRQRTSQLFRELIKRFPSEVANAYPQDIVGDNPDYRLEYVSEVRIGDVTHKIITFSSQTQVVEQGASTSIFVLSWDGGVYSVQELQGAHFLAFRPFGSRLLYCDFRSAGDEFYIFNIQEHKGAEGTLELSVYAYLLKDGQWVRNNLLRNPPPFGTEQAVGKWILMNGPTFVYNRTYAWARDHFDVKVQGTDIAITAMKQGQPVEGIKLVFEDGGWVVEW